MKRLIDWFDHRTGVRSLIHEALYERIPGGARWRYVWGSTLVFAFATQMITGMFLWMAYSPSAQTAWESVYYIQFDMQGGWLLRGLHHFMAQAMIVLLALHLIQVVIDGAYRAPREINFWLGLILMNIVLGLSLTGYLLPWDQKGYWATQVATKLTGVIPVVGIPMQRLIVGGTTYGHQTLTRFFALHAGVLPGLLIFFLVIHVALFRRHGICVPQPDRNPETTFWPDQVLKDAVACLGVLAVVLLLILWPGFTGDHSAWSVRGGLGADLGAPADPSRAYSAARPEWYFLFLFQFLKLFHGEEQEFLGAIVVPGVVMLLMALMPLFGKWKLGHYFNIGLLFVLLLGVVALTGMAMVEDRGDPDYQIAVKDAHQQSERVLELITHAQGIPPMGAVSLLHADPLTQGPVLFAMHCGSCHAHQDPAIVEVGESISAPNLFGIGSRQWVAGLLDPQQIAGPHYFGKTSHAEGEMAGWVQSTVPDMDDAARADLVKVVAALSAEAALPSQMQQDKAEGAMITEGRELLVKKTGCIDCHKFRDAGELGTAPELTGWGSRQWLLDFVANPTQERFYGDNNDRMPGFYEHPESPSENRATKQELELIVDWLRRDWPRASEKLNEAVAAHDATAGTTPAATPAAAPTAAPASNPAPATEAPPASDAASGS